MSFPQVALSTVAEVNPRFDHPANRDLDERVSFVPMANVSATRGAITKEEERSLANVLKGFTPFVDRDVLLAKITPCFENGKIAHARITKRFGFGSTEFHVIRAQTGTLDDRYIYQYLRTPSVRAEGVRRMTGSAGQKRVPKAFLDALLVPLPSLHEQRRIAAVLDKADALRVQRRAAIAKLDELLQSVFIEMFGDPLTNPKKFPVRSLPEFYTNAQEGTKCGPFGSALKKSELVESGVPVWNMDNIAPSGRMLLPFRMWITEEKYRQLEAYSVRSGDILISRAGTVGKMCVAETGDFPSVLSTNLIRVRLGSKLLPLFFVSLMTYCKGRVGRLKAGPDGAFTHMSTGILDTLQFPYPPVALQQRFAQITERIEAQKQAMHRAAEKSETLFASLQQRAFSGKL